MFEAKSSYTFRYCNSEKLTEDGLTRRRFVFVFMSQHKRKYTLWADQFDESVPFFAIKFFPSCLIKSDNKFKKVVNDGDMIRVVGTCFQIMLHLGNMFSGASFSYVAEPQRHRIYERGLARIFSDVDYTFDHHCNSDNDNLYVITHIGLSAITPNLNQTIDNILDHYGFVL